MPRARAPSAKASAGNTHAAAAGPRSGSARAAAAEHAEGDADDGDRPPDHQPGAVQRCGDAGLTGGVGRRGERRGHGRQRDERGEYEERALGVRGARQHRGTSGEDADGEEPGALQRRCGGKETAETAADPEPVQHPLEQRRPGLVDPVGDGVPAGSDKRRADRSSQLCRQSAQTTRWASTDAAVMSSTVAGVVARTGRAGPVERASRCWSCQCSSKLDAGPHHAGLDGSGRDAEQVARLTGGETVEHRRLDDRPQLGGQVPQRSGQIAVLDADEDLVLGGHHDLGLGRLGGRRPGSTGPAFEARR